MKIGRREFLVAGATAPFLLGQTQAPGAARVRSMMRLFASEVEDKPWFYGREMWPAYFSMLAENRFNRFQLAFGIGYDFLRQVTDAYGLFLYPFLLDVPGYKVRAVNLPAAEPARNLETLRFISDQAKAHGLHFQLGVWMHGYEWENSPNANYTIAGLTAENHGPYCRDALTAVLKACPSIAGVTLRIHGESGVTEGSYDFWKTVFDGAVRSGRKLELDLHAKGIDQKMIDTALATGLPVTVSPKFVAEHMGMPYHQAAIRETEMPKGARTGLMALSTGTRSFTRYSYADLMREDRKYGVIHRVWPGTQRLLLWGDPVTAAGYARAFEICGSEGAEIMEPLSFKGRRGSGKAGGRCAYVDASLKPRWDWEKYRRTYQVWGSALAGTQVESRGFEKALEIASRILPMVTTAHAPSAANNTYWPEMYTVQPMVEGAKGNPYTDTPAPRTFGAASPFDPQLFLGVNEFVDEVLKRERSGKYSPIEVAQWLEELAGGAETELTRAGAPKTVDERRTAIDVRMQIALGRFFAGRFRAAVQYAIFERNGDQGALAEALKTYRAARATWAAMAQSAKGVYVDDVTVGEQAWLRGHWMDRLPAMDADIEAMAKRAAANTSTGAPKVEIAPAVRNTAECSHAPAARFSTKAALPVELKVPREAQGRLWYRHFDQAERWESAQMKAVESGALRAAIPSEYTATSFPMQYYFEVRMSAGRAWLYPGFDAQRANQPYFVVRPA